MTGKVRQASPYAAKYFFYVFLLFCLMSCSTAAENRDPFPDGIPKNVEQRFVKAAMLTERAQLCRLSGEAYSAAFLKAESQRSWSDHQLAALRAFFDGIRGYYSERWRSHLCPEELQQKTAKQLHDEMKRLSAPKTARS